jgi:hypothetical protein
MIDKSLLYGKWQGNAFGDSYFTIELKRDGTGSFDIIYGDWSLKPPISSAYMGRLVFEGTGRLSAGMTVTCDFNLADNVLTVTHSRKGTASLYKK